MNIQEIIKDALEHIGKLGAGETVSAEDNELALRALQNIFSEMPIHGFTWAKVKTVPTSLIWSSITPERVEMPSDYFGSPRIYFIQDGMSHDLEIITKAKFDDIPNPLAPSDKPASIFIDANNIGYMFPVPTSNPMLLLRYQSIPTVPNVQDNADILPQWNALLGLWLGFELCGKFDVVIEKAREIERKYLAKKRICLAYAAESAPIEFTVSD